MEDWCKTEQGEIKKKSENKGDRLHPFISFYLFSAQDFHLRKSGATNFKRQPGRSWSVKSEKRSKMRG
ncbi:hypothetical protein CgunFtcFv8_010983 [Champsocephalus gunnari]|uniref:Uncharacterized protein n=1 Tax=Champsocephalus gunnari TaxID=52237 RepID=A0AAN8E1J2_CHAGU|nr:hypothetical protein CgunFtcFv8_010983 [Champsocephalus gunnari]